MISRIDIVRQAEELLADRLEQLGYELVACDWRPVGGRSTLQVFIDREGGVGIQDCVKVNDAIGDLLDVEDLIPGRYHLEISSPGLDRPLRKEADFQRFAGRQVRIRTFEPIDGRRNYRGAIVGVDDGIVQVEVDGTEYPVPIAAMERANLVYEPPQPEGGPARRPRRTRRGGAGR